MQLSENGSVIHSFLSHAERTDPDLVEFWSTIAPQQKQEGQPFVDQQLVEPKQQSTQQQSTQQQQQQQQQQHTTGDTSRSGSVGDSGGRMSINLWPLRRQCGWGPNGGAAAAVAASAADDWQQWNTLIPHPSRADRP